MVVTICSSCARVNRLVLQIVCCIGAFAFAVRTFAADFGSPSAREHVASIPESEIAAAVTNNPASTLNDFIAADDIVSTRTSVPTRWSPRTGAIGYRLDVSKSSSFADYVDGYHSLDVGLATSWVVTGLAPGTTYFYRVTAYDSNGLIAPAETKTATTAASSGLIINATFDSSITSNPNSSAIQAAINHVIAIYESLFADPVTVSILFRYSSTRPNGTAIANVNQIALSNYVVYSP